MSDEAIANAILLGVGAVLSWVGNLVLQRFKHRDENAVRRQAREEKLAENRDSLAIELLKVARSEATALHQKIADLEQRVGDLPMLERRASYFEEALLHLEAVVTDDPAVGRDAAEHNARLFLARMVGMRELNGRAANREQVERARIRQMEGGNS